MKEHTGPLQMTRRELIQLTAAMLASTTLEAGFPSAPAHAAAAPPNAPINLLCEYLTNPLGIDTTTPRLTWESSWWGRQRFQSAYRILVASTLSKLNANIGDIWDSGKVISSQSALVPYAGAPLAAGNLYAWKVQAWNNHGNLYPWSAPAFWSMGLLTQGWNAQWMWYPEGNPAQAAPVAARYFRREINLPADNPLVSASCVLTADNSFTLFVNGVQAGTGSDWTTPQQFTLTVLLRPGVNVLAIQAVNGGSSPNPAGVLGIFTLQFAQGNPLVVATDAGWRASQQAPGGWLDSDFNDSAWACALPLGQNGIQPWGTLSQMAALPLSGVGDWKAQWIQQNLLVTASLAAAHWMWYPEGSPAQAAPVATRYFRRSVTLPSGNPLVSASCVLTADNSFTLFVNGVQAGTGSDWTTPQQFTLTVLLRPGVNVLAIQAVNGGSGPNPAGVLGIFTLQFADGSTQGFTLDTTWKASQQGPGGWNAAGFDDSAWVAAADLGLNGISPWGTIAYSPTSVPMFRRDFSLGSGISRATAYICGLGQFEMHVNGVTVSSDVLQPGWTDYRKTCLYVTYDVTSLLRSGSNALGILLGNGMYNVENQRYMKFTGTYGPQKLILQLNVEYANGMTAQIVSDGTWEAAAAPTTLSGIYGNEDYDARLEMPGWDAPGFTPDSRWQPAQVTQGPGGALRAQMIQPIKIMQTYAPVSAPVAYSGGSYLYDFGQNMSGRPLLSVTGPAGSTVALAWGEQETNGNVYNSSCSGYYSYTLKGSGVEVWTPTFSYTGFRYLSVTGAVPQGVSNPSNLPVIQSLTAQFLYPDIVTGSFTCSNTLLNQIHHLILYAILSNTKSIFTDCPTREKMGWLEETQLMAPAIMNNCNVAALYAKVLGDMRDAQLDNGLVPDIAPEYTVFGGDYRDSPEWGSACVLVPWAVYQRYGDMKVLRDNYAAMVRYVNYLTGRSSGSLLPYGLGDWREVASTPNTFTASALYYQDVTILQQTAALLGLTSDAQNWTTLAGQIKAAFNAAYFNASTSQYAGGTQTGNGMGLTLGLVPSANSGAALNNLISDIQANANHTTSGEVGWPYVIRALMTAGRSDVLYNMAIRTDNPSYGYQVVNGATTLTEDWDGPTRGDSQNHLMLGHLDDWFYRGIAGIWIDYSLPAGQQVTVWPQIVGDLTSASGACHTSWGPITSAWSRQGTMLTLNVTIPANAVVIVYVPTSSPNTVQESGKPVAQASGVQFLRSAAGANVYQVESGSYVFTALLSQ